MGQHRSAAPPDYDRDFFAWTQHQAKLLQALRRWPAEIPAELDLDRVAAEIEALGSAELNQLKGLLRQIMVHLIKAASDPEAQAVGHWRTEATTFQVDMLDRYTPSMRQHIEVQKLWAGALKVAKASLLEHRSSLGSHVPADCPYTLQDFVSPSFDFDTALETIGRGAAAA